MRLMSGLVVVRQSTRRIITSSGLPVRQEVTTLPSSRVSSIHVPGRLFSGATWVRIDYQANNVVKNGNTFLSSLTNRGSFR